MTEKNNKTVSLGDNKSRTDKVPKGYNKDFENLCTLYQNRKDSFWTYVDGFRSFLKTYESDFRKENDKDSDPKLTNLIEHLEMTKGTFSKWRTILNSTYIEKHFENLPMTFTSLYEIGRFESDQEFGSYLESEFEVNPTLTTTEISKRLSEIKKNNQEESPSDPVKSRTHDEVSIINPETNETVSLGSIQSFGEKDRTHKGLEDQMTTIVIKPPVKVLNDMRDGVSYRKLLKNVSCLFEKTNEDYLQKSNLYIEVPVSYLDIGIQILSEIGISYYTVYGSFNKTPVEETLDETSDTYVTIVGRCNTENKVTETKKCGLLQSFTQSNFYKKLSEVTNEDPMLIVSDDFEPWDQVKNVYQSRNFWMSEQPITLGDSYV